jgi:hypothetical protein
MQQEPEPISAIINQRLSCVDAVAVGPHNRFSALTLRKKTFKFPKMFKCSRLPVFKIKFLRDKLRTGRIPLHRLPTVIAPSRAIHCIRIFEFSEVIPSFVRTVIFWHAQTCFIAVH